MRKLFERRPLRQGGWATNSFDVIGRIKNNILQLGMGARRAPIHSLRVGDVIRARDNSDSVVSHEIQEEDYGAVFVTVAPVRRF